MITTVNAREVSIPSREKKPTKLPSTTPTPSGKKDKIPKSIEVV
jgi:hypothetical protein